MNRDEAASLAREIREHFPNGKIHAIKVLRQHSKISLAGAKTAVDGMWDDFKTAQAGGHLNDDFALAALSRSGVALRPLGIEQEGPVPRAALDIATLAREISRSYPNGKIEAIKHVRLRTGLGLKEAKDAVDSAWVLLERSSREGAQRQPESSDRNPEYEVKSSGIPLIAWVVIVIVGAAVALVYFR